ncbi:MAG: RNA ligase RtcB family protein [Beijerinckiaceae bacterium]|nr:RNA ligase RtcB family protein [Beijerinckiaceae bacterium]
MAGRAPVHTFYSDTAWIEGAAVDQLNKVAELADAIAVAAMPDLHPGKYGPVGCAILTKQVHPEFVGSDIGCGMSLFALDEPARKLRLDKAASRLRVLGESWDGDTSERLASTGLSACGFEQVLGTIGGGNHFCEVQAVADVLDGPQLEKTGLQKDTLCLLVHSGSRGLGNAILADTLANGLVSLDPASAAAKAYREKHDAAVRWASLNRQVIAERAAAALRLEARLIVDAPHNMLENFNGNMLHRKGAATVNGSADGFVPVAGSRATLSFLVRWTGGSDAMQTLSHGAGRKYDRASARQRGSTDKSALAREQRNPYGGYVICEDKALLKEEAAEAYKDCGKVVGDLVAHGLAAQVATLKPLVTFKTIREAGVVTSKLKGWKR